MDANQVVKRGRKPHQRSDGNRQDSASADRARVEGAEIAESLVSIDITPFMVKPHAVKSSIDWPDLAAIMEDAQLNNPNSRIVRAWHHKGPDIWQGPFGNAPVEYGDPAYQLNTGEIIAI